MPALICPVDNLNQNLLKTCDLENNPDWLPALHLGHSKSATEAQVSLAKEKYDKLLLNCDNTFHEKGFISSNWYFAHLSLYTPLPLLNTLQAGEDPLPTRLLKKIIRMNVPIQTIEFTGQLHANL